MRWLCASLVGLAAASGCMVGPNYETPVTQTPQEWSGVPSTTASATQPGGVTTRPADVDTWWHALNDSTLDSLLDRAVRSNLDLRVATARVREARASRAFIAADLWPQVGVSSSYDYRGGSLNTGAKPLGQTGLAPKVGQAALGAAGSALTSGQAVTPAGLAKNVLNSAASTVINEKLAPQEVVHHRGQNLFQAGFDANWELDVFGGLRRAVEAADADLAATEEDRNDVLVTLLSEVALNYVQLRGFQHRLEIAIENLAAQKDTLDVTQDLLRSGFGSELEVAQARTQYATTQSQVPLLSSAIRQSVYQISVLLGQPPASLERELEETMPIPKVPDVMAVGLPSELLRRRPDVRAAERQLAAATARVGEAMADLFPKFSLTGSFGAQSRNINHLLERDSLTWSVGPGVSWPVFDGWRIRSNIEIQDARQEQAAAVYEQTVLLAFQEVENALTAYLNEQDRYVALTDAVRSSRLSRRLSNELYTGGLGPFLNVLEAQRAVYASQDAMVQSQTTIITNLISLYKALGGGWTPPERMASSARTQPALN